MPVIRLLGIKPDSLRTYYSLEKLTIKFLCHTTKVRVSGHMIIATFRDRGSAGKVDRYALTKVLHPVCQQNSSTYTSSKIAYLLFIFTKKIPFNTTDFLLEPIHTNRAKLLNYELNWNRLTNGTCTTDITYRSLLWVRVSL